MVICCSFKLLGNGAKTTTQTTPVDVIGISTAVAIGVDHACAELNSGGIKCRGTNSSGELGAGFTSSSSNVPLTTVGITTSAGLCIQTQASTCAIVGNGMKRWGGNWFGQLGNGSLTGSTIPVKTLL